MSLSTTWLWTAAFRCLDAATSMSSMFMLRLPTPFFSSRSRGRHLGVHPASLRRKQLCLTGDMHACCNRARVASPLEAAPLNTRHGMAIPCSHAVGVGLRKLTCALPDLTHLMVSEAWRGPS